MFNKNEQIVEAKKELVNYRPVNDKSVTYFGSLVNDVGERLFDEAGPHIVDDNDKEISVRVIQVQMTSKNCGFVEFIRLESSN